MNTVNLDLEKLPSPFAAIIGEYNASRRIGNKGSIRLWLWDIIQFCEYALRCYVSYSVPRRFSTLPQETRIEVARLIGKSPTLASWSKVAKTLLDATDTKKWTGFDEMILALSAFVEGDANRSLISIRNEVFHGVGITDAMLNRLLEKGLDTWFKSFVESHRVILENCKLIIPVKEPGNDAGVYKAFVGPDYHLVEAFCVPEGTSADISSGSAVFFSYADDCTYMRPFAEYLDVQNCMGIYHLNNYRTRKLDLICFGADPISLTAESSSELAHEFQSLFAIPEQVKDLFDLSERIPRDSAVKMICEAAQKNKVVWVTGFPGIGKSIIAQFLTQSCIDDGQKVAYVRFKDQSGYSLVPKAIAQALGFSGADLELLLEKDTDQQYSALSRRLKKNPENLTVVLDGLDECFLAGQSDRDFPVKSLNADGVSWVCFSRDESHLAEIFNSIPHHKSTIDRMSKEEIRSVFEKKVGKYYRRLLSLDQINSDGSCSNTIIDRLHDYFDGLPIVVDLVIRDICAGNSTFENPRMPRDYRDYFRRHLSSIPNDRREFYYSCELLLTVLPTGLREGDFNAIFGRYYDLSEKDLLSGYIELRADGYALYHKSYADLLVNECYGQQIFRRVLMQLEEFVADRHNGKTAADVAIRTRMLSSIMFFLTNSAISDDIRKCAGKILVRLFSDKELQERIISGVPFDIDVWKNAALQALKFAVEERGEHVYKILVLISGLSLPWKPEQQIEMLLKLPYSAENHSKAGKLITELLEDEKYRSVLHFIENCTDTEYFNAILIPLFQCHKDRLEGRLKVGSNEYLVTYRSGLMRCFIVLHQRRPIVPGRIPSEEWYKKADQIVHAIEWYANDPEYHRSDPADLTSVAPEPRNICSQSDSPEILNKEYSNIDLISEIEKAGQRNVRIPLYGYLSCAVRTIPKADRYLERLLIQKYGIDVVFRGLPHWRFDELHSALSRLYPDFNFCRSFKRSCDNCPDRFGVNCSNHWISVCEDLGAPSPWDDDDTADLHFYASPSASDVAEILPNATVSPAALDESCKDPVLGSGDLNDGLSICNTAFQIPADIEHHFDSANKELQGVTRMYEGQTEFTRIYILSRKTDVSVENLEKELLQGEEWDCDNEQTRQILEIIVEEFSLDEIMQEIIGKERSRISLRDIDNECQKILEAIADCTTISNDLLAVPKVMLFQRHYFKIPAGDFFLELSSGDQLRLIEHFAPSIIERLITKSFDAKALMYFKDPSAFMRIDNLIHLTKEKVELIQKLNSTAVIAREYRAEIIGHELNGFNMKKRSVKPASEPSDYALIKAYQRIRMLVPNYTETSENVPDDMETVVYVPDFTETSEHGHDDMGTIEHVHDDMETRENDHDDMKTIGYVPDYMKTIESGGSSSDDLCLPF